MEEMELSDHSPLESNFSLISLNSFLLRFLSPSTSNNSFFHTKSSSSHTKKRERESVVAYEFFVCTLEWLSWKIRKKRRRIKESCFQHNFIILNFLISLHSLTERKHTLWTTKRVSWEGEKEGEKGENWRRCFKWTHVRTHLPTNLIVVDQW